MKATIKDFAIGAKLTTEEGYTFTLINKYADGIWEARGRSGDIVIFENNARFYTIKPTK
jgi:hypothetical protein